jgi:hypothetical protein
MNENVFYAALDIRSTDPIDKRFYIDEITTPNLTAIFGLNGRYAIRNAFIFNRHDRQFYYYTGTNAPAPDILNPANWSPYQVSATGRFVEWANDATYTTGDPVFDPATIPTGVKFYIAKTTTTPGEPPYLTPEEWVEVGSTGSTRQTALITLDTSLTNYDFQVVYTNVNLPSLPQVSTFARFGNNDFQEVDVSYSIDAATNTISFSMTGDFSTIQNVSENIRVVIT